MPADKQEIFLVRVLRQLPRNVRDGTAAVTAKLQKTCKWFERFEREGDILLLASLWIAATVAYFMLAWDGSKDFIVSFVIFGWLIPTLIAGALYIPFYVLKIRGAVLWSHLFFAVGMMVWTIACLLWHTLVVLTVITCLPPVFLIHVVTRQIQKRRGIHFTCPVCSRRGLPVHVCPNPRCGKEHPQLWPNLYGLLWHYCRGCNRRLKTLDIYGKLDLPRRCRNRDCRMPLDGKHGGRVPEQLVAIAGAPGTGKTCYLMMAVNRTIQGYRRGTTRVSGGIDVPAQRDQFAVDWRDLKNGVPPAKTAQVDSAFLLYININGAKSQLYLYDAPGEEFHSVGAMEARQYYSILKGLIVLVDPPKPEDLKRSKQALAIQENVVRTTLTKAISEMGTGKDGKVNLRVAVVICKADLPHVRQALGKVRLAEVASKTCHDTVASWGGRQLIRALENRVRNVDYFACSALGRDVNSRSNEPFRDSGVLEPIIWILTGKRA